jgi:hypothetical protein
MKEQQFSLDLICFILCLLCVGLAFYYSNWLEMTAWITACFYNLRCIVDDLEKE